MALGRDEQKRKSRAMRGFKGGGPTRTRTVVEDYELPRNAASPVKPGVA